LAKKQANKKATSVGEMAFHIGDLLQMIFTCSFIVDKGLAAAFSCCGGVFTHILIDISHTGNIILLQVSGVNILFKLSTLD